MNAMLWVADSLDLSVMLTLWPVSVGDVGVAEAFPGIVILASGLLAYFILQECKC